MLLWIGAIVSAFLGYRLYEPWLPAAVACAVVAIQFILFQIAGGGARDTSAELYALSLFMNLIISYATYGIGRAIGQRRKGVR